MLSLFLPFPCLQVEERVSETKLYYLFSALLLTFFMTLSKSLLFLSQLPKNDLRKTKLHFQIGLVVRSNPRVTKLNVSPFLQAIPPGFRLLQVTQPNKCYFSSALCLCKQELMSCCISWLACDVEVSRGRMRRGCHGKSLAVARQHCVLASLSESLCPGLARKGKTEGWKTIQRCLTYFL